MRAVWPSTEMPAWAEGENERDYTLLGEAGLLISTAYQQGAVLRGVLASFCTQVSSI